MHHRKKVRKKAEELKSIFRDFILSGIHSKTKFEDDRMSSIKESTNDDFAAEKKEIKEFENNVRSLALMNRRARRKFAKSKNIPERFIPKFSEEQNKKMFSEKPMELSEEAREEYFKRKRA